MIEISNENSNVKTSNSELDYKNKRLQDIIQKNNLDDIDHLVVTTQNKKEGFYESKSKNQNQDDKDDNDYNLDNNSNSKKNPNNREMSIKNNNGI